MGERGQGTVGERGQSTEHLPVHVLDFGTVCNARMLARDVDQLLQIVALEHLCEALFAKIVKHCITLL